MRSNWLIFLTTMGAMQSFNAILVVYCYIKIDIQRQFNMGLAFIGTIDFFLLIGQTLGILFFAIAVPFQPKRSFFYCCILQIFTFCIIGVFQQQQMYSHIFLCFAFVFFGFGRGSFMIPYFILGQRYDTQKEKQKFVIWRLFASLGYAIGILFGFLLQIFGVNWQGIIFAASLYFLIWTVAMSLCAEQVKLEKFVIQQITPSERARSLLMLVQQFLIQKMNILCCMQVLVMQICFKTMLFWFPYYFSKMRFEYKGSSIIFIASIITFFGWLFMYILRKTTNFQNSVWSVVCVLLNMICYLILNFIQIKADNIIKISVVLGFSGVLFGSVMQEGILFQSKQKINYKVMDKALLYCVFKALRGVITAVMMQIMSFIVGLKIQLFIVVLFIISFVVAVTHIKRVNYQKQYKSILQRKANLQLLYLKLLPKKSVRQQNEAFLLSHTPLSVVSKNNTPYIPPPRRVLKNKLTLQ